ncbi:MAG: hypothetical protein MUE33_06080 [Cytophagaceae bacterium]|jgi:hypothetical protein|nr:hypothetical protein [Cytophagaceae bacterium]
MKTNLLLKWAGSTMMYLLCFTYSRAQDHAPSAYQASLGYATVTDTSQWAIFHNPSAMFLSQKTRWNVVAGEQFYPGLTVLKSFQGGLVYQRPNWNLGFTFAQKGYSALHVSSFGIALAHRIGSTTGSIGFQGQQWSAQEQSSQFHWNIQMGIRHRWSEKWSGGIWMSNIVYISQPSLTWVTIHAGIQWRISPELLLMADIHRGLRQPSAHLALRYSLHRMVFTTLAYQSNATTLLLGGGVRFPMFELGYGLGLNPNTSTQHQFYLQLKIWEK